MDRTALTVVIAGFVLLAFAGMVLSWRSRRRRSAALAPIPQPVESLGAETDALELDYVATTRFEQPLERVLLPGLGFRGRAVLHLHASGLVVEPRGERSTVIPAALLRAVGEGSYAIDRAVETGGLLVVSWAPRGDEVLDSYFRILEPDVRERIAAGITRLLPTPSQKGQ